MKKYFLLIIFFLIPISSLAQGGLVDDELTRSGTVGWAILELGKILALLIPIMIALGIVIFFYGLAMYLLKAGEEEGQRGARNLMIYGIVAVFVMVSVWGLVAMIRTTFGVGGDEVRIDMPTVQGLGS